MKETGTDSKNKSRMKELEKSKKTTKKTKKDVRDELSLVQKNC
jgi:hypothetical protein